MIGRGALRGQRSYSGSSGGAHASENAGMSSDKTGENPVRRKPKGSPAMFVRRRLGGPKARPEGVADGHLVDIPDPAKRYGTLLNVPSRTVGSCGLGKPGNCALRRKGTGTDRGLEKRISIKS